MEYYGSDRFSDDKLKSAKDNYIVIDSKEFLRRMFLDKQQLCTAWGKLFSRSLFKEIRFPETVYYGEDMFFIIQAVQVCRKIVFDFQISYMYNQESISLVRSSYNINKLDRIKALKEWMKFADNYYPDLHDAAFSCCYSGIINECSVLLEWENDKSEIILNRLIKDITYNYCEIKSNIYILKCDKIKAFFLKNHFLKSYVLMRKVLLRMRAL